MISNIEALLKILKLVPIKTPAIAALGIIEKIGAKKITITNKNIECTIAATRVEAPDLTFTLVLAIAPVAGMPPKIEATAVAAPWPNNSWFGRN